MSGQINIRRDVQDLFYRYKMPRLQSKIEGKGNGIKTVIPNLVDVAKALGRPPAYLNKYFGAELGALSNCDEKAAKYLVNGAHDSEKLQTILDGFISKFVLCQKCENPETDLSNSKKDGTIYRSCQACGFKGPVDMGHKLVAFIRANPPPKPVKKTQAKDRADAHNSELASSLMGAKEDPSVEGIIAPDDFEESMDNASTSHVNEDDWAEESAAAAREQELATLSESVRSKLAIKPIDESMKALDEFGNWLDSHGQSSTNEEIIEKGSSFSNEQAIAAIMQTIFSGDDFGRVFRERLPLLQHFVSGEREQKALLGSMERLISTVNGKLLEKVNLILQTLYNSELVEEEVLMEWRKKPSRKYVGKEVGLSIRAKCDPFFEWLLASDSDEEEEEEEDGEDGEESE